MPILARDTSPGAALATLLHPRRPRLASPLSLRPMHPPNIQPTTAAPVAGCPSTGTASSTFGPDATVLAPARCLLDPSNSVCRSTPSTDIDQDARWPTLSRRCACFVVYSASHQSILYIRFDRRSFVLAAILIRAVVGAIHQIALVGRCGYFPFRYSRPSTPSADI
jgi:hypothetical protein